MFRRYRAGLVSASFAAVMGACAESRSTEPSRASSTAASHVANAVTGTRVREVRQLAAERGIGPLPTPPRVRRPLVLLGRSLAFDPILSGNRDISCMTCHVPAFGTGDAKSLSVGQGGVGLGPARAHAKGVFIPRNAPPLFNLGGMRRLFWDGVVEVDDRGELHTPAGPHLTPEMREAFEFGAVSALGLFPVTDRAEMRGDEGNELAEIPDGEFARIWRGLMTRLASIPEYRAMFEAAYPGMAVGDMTFAHASNAIGAFFVEELTFRNAPWDRFLAGDDSALTPRQLAGARTFLSLRCSICHGGPTFSDQEFHNVAVAQIGPGKANGPSGRDDFGRMNVSGREADRYRFRTTPLRNVELTRPYGHSGAIVDLRAFIAHYSESHLKLLAYDPGQLEPSLRATVLPTAGEILARRDPLLDGVVLTDEILDQLMDYMSALTDPAARTLKHVTPRRVPSGLPVVR